VITCLDRAVTRFVVTPLAVMAAWGKGMSNFSFGARLLLLSVVTMCPWGVWAAAQDGSMQLLVMFVLWGVGSVVLAGFAEFVGEYAYRPDAHVTYARKTTISNQALVITQAYRETFLARLWRVLLTVTLIAVGVMAVQNPVLGDATVPFFVQFAVFWLFCYTPTVERAVIEPYLYF